MSIKNYRTQWKVPAMIGKQVLLCVCVCVCVCVKQVALVEGDVEPGFVEPVEAENRFWFFTVASHLFIIQRNSRKTLLWQYEKCNEELA